MLLIRSPNGLLCPDKRWDDPGFFSCKRAERPPDLPGPREGPFAWIWALYRIPEEVGQPGFEIVFMVSLSRLAAAAVHRRRDASCSAYVVF